MFIDEKVKSATTLFREKAEQVLVGLFQIVYVGKLILVNNNNNNNNNSNNNNNNTLSNIIWKNNDWIAPLPRRHVMTHTWED